MDNNTTLVLVFLIICLAGLAAFAIYRFTGGD